MILSSGDAVQAPMRILAHCRDDVLVEQGDCWIFGRQSGAGGTSFVVGTGLGGIGLVIITVIRAVQDGVVAWAWLLPGLLLLACSAAVYVSRQRARKSSAIRPRLVLDFARGMLLDAAGRELAPLSSISFVPRHSGLVLAQKLECAWPGGREIVATGEELGDHLGPMRDALRSRGLPA
jgi:hypothetical protein